jgi:hypothetical protein
MVRGDQWARTLTLRSGTSPYDLTGCTLTSSIVRTLGGSRLAEPVTSVVSPTAGTVSIDITESISLGLTAGVFDADPNGQYWLVLRMVDASAQTRTLLQARMQILAGD